MKNKNELGQRVVMVQNTNTVLVSSETELTDCVGCRSPPPFRLDTVWVGCAKFT